MTNSRLFLIAAIPMVVMTACSTSSSGGYTYNNTSGSNTSQQHSGSNLGGFSQSSQSQTNISNSWSSKHSFSTGSGNQ
jgi:hypothetical protein